MNDTHTPGSETHSLGGNPHSGKVLWYWSPKGGVGTSVIAAATAIRLAADNHKTTLVDLTGDQPALLGMINSTNPEPGIGDWIDISDEAPVDDIERLCEDLAPDLQLLRQGTRSAFSDVGGLSAPPTSGEQQRLLVALQTLARAGPVVVDAGRDPAAIRTRLTDTHRPVCVMRPCYLALSVAQRVPGPYDRVVLIEETSRSLRARDVSAAVGASHVERVAWDPQVARAVDAGTIVSMLPPPLRRFELPV